MQIETIVCKECGKIFILTVQDQEWFINKGMKPPKRCKRCRQLLREQRKEANDNV